MDKRKWYALFVFLFLLICVKNTNSTALTIDGNVFSLQNNEAQKIVVDQQFFSKDELAGYPFYLNDKGVVFGAGITANIKLFNDASLVRVVLIDDQSEEYLVYETYSLLVDNFSFSVENACQETKILKGIKPVSLRVELFDASIELQSLSLVTVSPYSENELAELKKILVEKQEKSRIDLLNTQIKKKGMTWVAGHTSISSKTYLEKKCLFGGKTNILANLQGFEYYIDGVFEIRSNKPEVISPENLRSTTMVDSFDWRNRHGANNSKSPYYDGDALGGGWVTSIKDQALPVYCGSCWAHSTLAAAELLVNLYYNKHVDLDLAEQYLMACGDASAPGKPCSGGYPDKALKWVASHGNIEEASFPYTASDAPKCSDSAKSPKESIKFSGGMAIKIPTEDSLKRALIHYGPLNIGITSMSHAMALVGYAKEAGTGTTAWIFKNSHGTKTGVKGYTLVKTNMSDFGVSRYVLPLTSKIYTNDSIKCLDLDKDGFYNWGIGPKPATCPGNCPSEEDCDDSRNDLGPMAADGSCKKILTGIVVNSLQNSSIVYNCTTNPLNKMTTITFKATKNSKTMVRIYKISGSLIKTLNPENFQEDLQRVVWNGTNEYGKVVSNGPYICTISIDGGSFQSSSSFKIFIAK